MRGDDDAAAKNDFDVDSVMMLLLMIQYAHANPDICNQIYSDSDV